MRRWVAVASLGAATVAGSAAEGAIRYYTVNSCRAVDTRDASLGGPTPLGGSAPRSYALAGRCGTSPTASGLILNVTVTQPTGNGFVTVYPGGSGVPATSTINFRSGATRANSAIVRVGPGRAVSVVAGLTSGTVHVILDIAGYFDDTANNQPPYVSPGATQTVQLPGFAQSGGVSLTGSVTDDGRPLATPTVAWSVLAGPGGVSFSAPNSTTTNATFSLAGTYVLRLTASDSQLGGFADTTVNVLPSRDAWRLVQQATWGPTLALATQAQNMGPSAWLDAQIAAAPNGFPDYPLWPGSIPSTCTGTCQRDNYSLYLPQRHFFYNALYGQDQLRQRVAFAFHKIIPLTTQQPGQLRPYLHILRDNALGDFRKLLRDVTLNVAMGVYLDMITSTRRRPNENYAREILQLFSTGTDMLNPDGTLQRDGNGEVVPVYDQSVVDGFTKVFTGWTYPVQRTAGITNYIDPMRIVDSNHDGSDKLLLANVTRTACGSPTPSNPNPSSPSGCGVADLDFAIDNIFFHSNVGPFVVRQLIQQLVTSNPTPAYVGRVAAVFDNDGTGRRGNLAAVVKALLLDPEARGSSPSDPNYGHLKEPVLLVLNVLRAFDARSIDGLNRSDGYLSPQTLAMDQDLWRPPTVFSYFPADFEVPGVPGVAGPEFGILSASTALRRANFVNTIVFTGITRTTSNTNAPDGTSLNFDPLYGLASDPARLVDEVNMRLMGGNVSASMRSSMLQAVSAVTPLNARLRIQQAIYLAATSSQFQVQR
jgi:uncharacterized protein (DUF1800 family)